MSKSQLISPSVSRTSLNVLESPPKNILISPIVSRKKNVQREAVDWGFLQASIFIFSLVATLVVGVSLASNDAGGLKSLLPESFSSLEAVTGKFKEWQSLIPEFNVSSFVSQIKFPEFNFNQEVVTESTTGESGEQASTPTDGKSDDQSRHKPTETANEQSHHYPTEV
jgi:hypothetical protein